MFGNQALRYFGERLQRHAEIYAVYLNPDGSVRQSAALLKATPLYDRMLPNWSNIGTSMALLEHTRKGMLNILTSAAYLDDVQRKGGRSTWGYSKSSNFYVLEALPVPATQYEPLVVPQQRLSMLSAVAGGNDTSGVPGTQEILSPVAPWVRPSVVPLLWSPSPSVTVTPSVTSSVSGTASVTPSQTPSVTPTGTGSPSMSATATGTMSPTPSQTIVTRSPTPSVTASPTGALSPSPSSSAATTPTPTRSQDPSLSAPPSASAAPSQGAPTPPPERVLPRVTFVDAIPTPLPLVQLTVSSLSTGGSSALLPITVRALGQLTSIGVAVAAVGYTSSPSAALLGTASVNPDLAVQMLQSQGGGSPPAVLVQGPQLAGPLSTTAFTSLDTALLLSLDTPSIVAGGDLASAQGLFLFNVTAYASASLETVLSFPLFVQVTLPSGSFSPQSLEGYAQPDSGSAFMQKSLTIQNSGTAPMRWFLLQRSELSCWISAAMPGASDPSRGELLSLPPTAQVLADDPSMVGLLTGSVPVGAGAVLELRFDLAQLPQGLHEAEVVLVLGDVQGTTAAVPVRLLMATVQPCPSKLYLPPQAPPAGLAPSAFATVPITTLSLRNLGSQAVVVEQAVVLDGTMSVSPVAQACAANRNTTDVNTAVQVQFDALAMLAASQSSVTGWLDMAQVAGGSLVVPPSGEAKVPLSLIISSTTTPEPGMYVGMALLLINNTQTNALTLSSTLISVHVRQGTAAAQQSSVLPVIGTLSGQHLPLLPSAVITEAKLTQDSQVLTPDGLLLAYIVLRDSLGRPRQAGQDVLAARLQVDAAGPKRALSGTAANMSSLRALVRNLVPAELALLQSVNDSVSGVADEIPPGAALTSYLYGVFLPLSKVSSLPVGSELHIEVSVLDVESGSGSGSATTTLASRGTVSVARATCGPDQVRAGLVCECRAGRGASAASPRGAALTAATLACVPCGPGTVGVSPTVGPVSSPSVCQRCGDGTFSLPGSTVCSPCPEGAVCGDGILAVLPGYALAGTLLSSNGTGLMPSAQASSIGQGILLCPNPLACEAPAAATSLEWSSYSVIPTTCAEGHEGDLCGVCADGYTYSPVAGGASVDCVPCHTSAWGLVWLTILLSLTLLGCMLWLWREILGASKGAPQAMVEVPPALQVPEVQQGSRADWSLRKDGPLVALVVDAGAVDVRSQSQLQRSGMAQTRFICLWLLVLHLQWSSQLESYRLGTVPGMEGVGVLSHIASVVPVHAAYWTCATNAHDDVAAAFAIGAALPLIGLLASCVVGCVVAALALGFRRSPRPSLQTVLATLAAAFVISLFMTIPRSMLSMVTVFLTLPASPQAEYMLQGFKELAGSPVHVQLQVGASFMAIIWGLIPAVLLWRGHRAVSPAALPSLSSDEGAGAEPDTESQRRSEGTPSDTVLDEIREEVDYGADNTTTWPVATAATALLNPQIASKLAEDASTAFAQSREWKYADAAWSALGWSWGFFRPSMWWYSLAWLGQCLALALAAAASPFLINRAYMAGAVCAIGMAANLWLQPLLMTGDAPTWASLPLLQHAVRKEENTCKGHATRLAAVSRMHRQSVLVHSLSVLVHGGVMVQAGFTFAMFAWRSGAFFAEAGRSNPYLSAVEVNLEAADAVVVTGVNLGFWIPLLALLFAVLFPRPALGGIAVASKAIAAVVMSTFTNAAAAAKPRAKPSRRKAPLALQRGKDVEMTSLQSTVLVEPSKPPAGARQPLPAALPGKSSALRPKSRRSRRTSKILQTAAAEAERHRTLSVQSMVRDVATGFNQPDEHRGSLLGKARPSRGRLGSRSRSSGASKAKA